jgi:hypothetical protein
MSMHIDWPEEIEASVDTLPDRAPGEYAAAGRRAVRRRRLAVSTLGLCAVALVGSIGWAALPDGSSAPADAPVASDPNGGSAQEDEPAGRFHRGGLVTFTRAGLDVRDGVEVVRRVDNPLGLKAPYDSIGLVLRHDGVITWMSLEASKPDGSPLVHEPWDPAQNADEISVAAESGWPTFDLWLAESVAVQTGQPTLRLAAMEEDGTLRAAEDGVRLLDQETNPHLPEYGGTGTLGVAMLRWREQTWFVLVARYGDRQDVIETFAARKAGGADDIESFLDFARDHFEEPGPA